MYNIISLSLSVYLVEVCKCIGIIKHFTTSICKYMYVYVYMHCVFFVITKFIEIFYEYISFHS